MCGKANAGKRVVQETVVATADGSLANVFVSVQGSFPQTAVPTTPVVIDQRGCMYTPRVVGARVGQILQVRNSDELLHNVHSFSSRNPFNIGQPQSGMVQPIPMKAEDIMLSIKCDVHRWMSAYVGVVNHPYLRRHRRGRQLRDFEPAGGHATGPDLARAVRLANEGGSSKNRRDGHPRLCLLRR